MEPRYRASLCKSMLESFSAFATKSGHERALFDAVDPSHAAAIHAASRGDWLTVIHTEALYTAVLEVCGEAALLEFAREHTRSATDMKMFGPMLKGALNLFGGGPRGLYRIVPRSWDLVTRDCGTLTASLPQEGGAAQLAYRELPPGLQSESFCVASRGSMLGLLDFAGNDGDITTDAAAMSSGTVILHVRWT